MGTQFLNDQSHLARNERVIGGIRRIRAELNEALRTQKKLTGRVAYLSALKTLRI